MSTVRQLCSDAALAGGYLGNSETQNNDDAQMMLRRLQRMLDSWSNENLMVYEVYEDSLTMTAAVQSYSTSLLSRGRPIDVDAVYVRYGVVDYPLKLISNQEWEDIPVKGVGGIPEKCYIDTGYPQLTLYFFPYPFATMTAYVAGRAALTSALTLDTSLSLPPGYEKAICDNLAVDCAGSFGKTPSPALVASANDSKAILKRKNYIPLEMESEAPIGRDLFNIYRGY